MFSFYILLKYAQSGPLQGHTYLLFPIYSYLLISYLIVFISPFYPYLPYILATVTMRLPSVVITYQLRVSHPLYHFTLFLSYLLLSCCS